MYAHHEHQPAKKTGMNQSKKVGSCISVYLQCKRYDARRDYEREDLQSRLMLASAHLPHYKIFESKQAAERLANEYGAEVMEVQMAL
jgi:hypothetical protein